ncbi:hypothetical protein BGZ61DRAFT_557551 [Ilyonectria robusta]|uniref:uncharacterized protein n=1 Tax=Ilyonectria robusta TaxID=1079257 RepID=UPI001E8DC7D7|nr:uncharacterized protein BGZ61DRAFT_557551 [Ilyonectria robusta]KAH8669238.1 hypothetical protein BGZ61DRAFT_557551 [Ilyonectria robusta]
MLGPDLTQSFLNEDELEEQSGLSVSSQGKLRAHNSLQSARRGHKNRIRRDRASGQRPVGPDQATISRGFARSGSASYATQPRLSLETTPKTLDSELTTPTGVIPCTPLVLAARPEGGDPDDKKHQATNSPVTIVVSIMALGAPTTDAPTAGSCSKLEIKIQQGPTNEIKLEGWGWVVTSTNVAHECRCSTGDQQ